MRMRTIPHTVSYDGLRYTITYPLSQCKAEPLAAIYVGNFEELLGDWNSVNAKRLALNDKASEAQARVDNTGRSLNRVAGRVVKAILTLTDDKRDDPLYMAYLGDKVLSEFKRRFTSKLKAMRGWASNLKISGHPSLVALADDVEKAVAEADAAVTMREDVANEKRYFRDVGDRKKLIDKTNAVCKSVHGELARLPHEIPGLPTDFADRFFVSESRDKDNDETEIEDQDPVQAAHARLSAARQEVADAEEHLKVVEAERAAAEKAAAVLRAEQTELAALEAEIAEKAKRVAALKAKIEK